MFPLVLTRKLLKQESQMKLSADVCDPSAQRPDESLPTFVAVNVSNRIRVITTRHLLFPSSSTCHSFGSPYGSVSLHAKEECRAYPVPLN